MTVAVYLRNEFLMADTRSTGGHEGLSDDHKKICKFGSDNAEAWLVTSGIAVMMEKKVELIKRHFFPFNTYDELEFAKKLYEFKDELSPLCGENYEAILVFHQKENHFNMIPFTAYKLSKDQVIAIKEFCAIGSGGYLAEGIYLSNPQTPPEDYARLVSKREVSVGEKSTVVKFN